MKAPERLSAVTRRIPPREKMRRVLAGFGLMSGALLVAAGHGQETQLLDPEQLNAGRDPASQVSPTGENTITRTPQPPALTPEIEPIPVPESE